MCLSELPLRRFPEKEMEGVGECLLFAPELDARVIKRIRLFRDLGWRVTTFTWERHYLKVEHCPDWDHVFLGRVKPYSYLRRLFLFIRAIPALYRRRNKIRGATVDYAINLDCALFAHLASMISGRSSQIVYEVGDVHKICTFPSVQGRVVRLLERLILRRSRLLVVTSPAFVSEYFEPVQRYPGPWFLLENKVYPSPAGHQNPVRKRGKLPWVIGLFGKMRDHASLQILLEATRREPELIELVLAGYPTMDAKRFEKMLHGVAGVKWLGAYRLPEDLPTIYGQVDFAWCLELTDVEANSKWLLPNRLYEGGIMRVPLLGASGTMCGEKIEQLGVGWNLESPYLDNLLTFLASLTPEEFQSKRSAYAELSSEEFASCEGFKDLLIQLRCTVPGSAASPA